MKDIEAVLFDVDGTILDTSEGIVNSVKDTINKYGLEMLPQSELLKFIGPPMEWSMESRLGLKGDRLKEAVGYFRDIYAHKNLMQAKPYDGIYGFFDRLKELGIPTAIATYKKQDYAEKICRGFAFGEYTDIIYGSDYEGKLTKADIIELCIRDLGVSDRKKILMVGDSSHDAGGALKAGVSFAGVTYGFGFGKFGGEDPKDYKIDYLCDTPAELTALF
ncbi:MAG: HAD hydrolase-like protein [Saccharofermentans sp.]|nr:HAD hydrolase-like protein [Saccharofermentans sp.]